MPKTTKKAPIVRLTISTCTRLADEQHEADVDPAARGSAAGRPALASRSSRARLARHPHEQEGGAEDDEEADHRRRRRRSLMLAEDVPHLLGGEREQGEDRQQRHRLRQQAERRGELAREPRERPSAGSPAGRRRRPRRSARGSAGSPRSWPRNCRADRRRSAAAAPAGATNAASSVLPMRSGIALGGQPKATLITAIATSMKAIPPMTASTFCHQLQSS